MAYQAGKRPWLESRRKSRREREKSRKQKMFYDLTDKSVFPQTSILNIKIKPKYLLHTVLKYGVPFQIRVFLVMQKTKPRLRRKTFTNDACHSAYPSTSY